jgi:hypothetical protein
MRKLILSLLIIHSAFLNAQDSLPDFSVVHKGNNRVIISWNNKFPALKQISIQRSSDSVANFRTLITVPDPNNKQNGYLDAKAPDGKIFYRLYILVDGSHFIFSKSKRPQADSIRTALVADTASKLTGKTVTDPVKDTAYQKVVEKIIKENLPDSALTKEELTILAKYRNNRLDLINDPVSKKPTDLLKTNNKLEVVVPQYRIVANKDGLVTITLKDFKEKKYSIRFYEDDETFLFELKDIKASAFMMEKSNFLHSGWFRSELYDNGKLIEKNRFFIPKDF